VPLPEDIDEDLLAVLREALTNVTRHAQAAGAEVEVAATVDRLTVKVADDGTGIDAAPACRSGLDNLARRAHDRRGTFSAEALHRSGRAGDLDRSARLTSAQRRRSSRREAAVGPAPVHPAAARSANRAAGVVGASSAPGR
jgi:signal transduction histidine kinase